MENKLENQTTADLDNQLKQGAVLADFWAPWCGPCRMQGQILEPLHDQLPAGVRIVKINVDENPELAGRFGVQSIPTLILFHEGRPVQKWVGVQTAATLTAAMKRAAGA